jgi:diaphanous 1
MVSFDEGHRTVLAALSEYRVAYNELFRFHSLVSALKIPDSVEFTVPQVTFSMEEEGVWEARTAFMALINALTNCPPYARRTDRAAGRIQSTRSK